LEDSSICHLPGYNLESRTQKGLTAAKLAAVGIDHPQTSFYLPIVPCLAELSVRKKYRTTGRIKVMKATRSLVTAESI